MALRRYVAELLRRDFHNHEHRITADFGVAGTSFTVSDSLPVMCSMFSVKVAAALITTIYSSGKPFLILSDSASVISAPQSNKPKHPVVF